MADERIQKLKQELNYTVNSLNEHIFKLQTHACICNAHAYIEKHYSLNRDIYYITSAIIGRKLCEMYPDNYINKENDFLYFNHLIGYAKKIVNFQTDKEDFTLTHIDPCIFK